MKIAGFDHGRIGIVEGESIIDLTEVLGMDPGAWPPVGMVRLIAEFAALRPRIDEAVARGVRRALSSVRLDCPILWPNKVIAYPANYHAHIEEMKTGTGLISKFTATGQGFFLKANSSLSGPRDPIMLPAVADREIHHECELAVIIGKQGRDIPRAQALDHVFGYSCLFDIVIRGREERVMRKSFDSFCPVGPYITTKDEVPDYEDIDLELHVGTELRQKANTRDLIVDIPDMIRMASSVMTLYPGDIIASGTPSGVARIAGGDVLRIDIARVGSMSLDVVQGNAGAHPVWDKPAS